MQTDNPFLTPHTTPHGAIPFDKIRLEHYEPALMEGIRQDNEEIRAITDNPEPPTFDNTIAALDYGGRLLEEVSTVMDNLDEAETSDELQELVRRMTPILTEHSNDVSLNAALFDRVKVVYENWQNGTERIETEEQQRLLDDTYRSFVRSGASLNDDDKALYRQLTAELAQATVLFGQNHLKATNAFRLNITDEERLTGLPETALLQAEEEAEDHDEKGWTFTLHAPSAATATCAGSSTWPTIRKPSKVTQVTWS